MFNYSRRLLTASVLASAAIFAMAGSAQSSPVDLLPGNPNLGIFIDHFPTGLNENKIFLQKGVGNTVYGNVGSKAGFPVVDFFSKTPLSATKGFGNGDITGSAGVYHKVTITVPGFTFEDFMFNVDLKEKNDKSDLTIKAYDGKTLLGKFTLGGSGIDEEENLKFLVLAQSGAVITSIVLKSLSGFEDLSLFKISGLVDPPSTDLLDSTPIPGALLLFGTVLAGATGVGGWRKRRTRMLVA